MDRVRVGRHAVRRRLVDHLPRGAADRGARLTEEQARTLARLEAEAALEAPDVPLLGDTAGLWGGGGGSRIAPPVDAPPGGTPVEPGPPEVHTERHGARTLWIAGDVVVTEVGAGVWVMAQRERALEVLERFDGEEDPVVETPTHALAERVGLFEHHVGVVLTDLGASELLVPDEDAEGEDRDDYADLLAEIRAAALHLDLSEGVEIAMLADTDHPTAARRLASRLRDDLRQAVRDDVVGVLGLPRLLARIEPRAEEDAVRLDLRLDRAEAHLWWGRISGLVGGALVVVGWLGDLFSGATSAFEDMDLPDAAPPMPVGGTIEGRVVAASPGAPVQPGAQCAIHVLPAEDRGDQWTCHATVTCDGKPLYGGPDSGWFFCGLGTADDWFLSGMDESPTAEDGDPVFTVDTIDRRATVRDDSTGSYGEYEIEIAIDSVVPEPQ